MKPKVRPIENNYAVDLSNCDEEPIHLLGKVQSHGIFMAFHARKSILSHFSKSCQTQLRTYLNKKNEPLFKDIFGHEVFEDFLRFKESKLHTSLRQQAISWEGSDYLMHFSKSQNHIIVELEELSKHLAMAMVHSLAPLDDFINSGPSYKSEQDMATNAVYHFRQLTGFDRVMYYKFDENGDGEVLAEDKSMGLEPFLGLRYPASDIPKQARKLYETNLVRSIKDINDPGEPLFGLGDAPNIDLSYAIYRSVSPIHLQYLANMGVTATHANSILYRGKLWGMLICHHYTGPRSLGISDRMLSIQFSNGISRWLQEFHLQEEREVKKKISLFSKSFQIPRNRSLFELIKEHWQLINDELDLCGFSCIEGTEIKSYKQCPRKPTLLKLSEQLHNADNPKLICHSKAEFGLELEKDIAGVFGFDLNIEPRAQIFFFRKEKSIVYNWAGEPQSKTEQGPLSPRESFKLWKEKVEGEAKPWSNNDQIWLYQICEDLKINLFHQQVLKNQAKNVDANLENSLTLKLRQENLLLIDANEELETKLRAANRRFKNISNYEQLQKVVIANLSHEMRTPLNGIMGLSDVLIEGLEENQEFKEYAQMIKTSGNRMLNTFNRLLNLNRFSIDGQGNEKQKSIDFEKLLQESLAPLKILAKTRQQNLVWQIHNHKSYAVNDPNIIIQIIVNLVQNSIKYAGDGKTITVDLKVIVDLGAKRLICQVEDDGVGIPESEQHKIFEAFYQSGKSTLSSDQSSGLGLFLVKSYVGFLKGKIELESKVNEGCRFTIKIPLNE